jgi:hypothetical protein
VWPGRLPAELIVEWIKQVFVACTQPHPISIERIEREQQVVHNFKLLGMCDQA